VNVGIWCAYGQTLEPTEGIGVFAHELARALADSPRVGDVWLAVHAGDEPAVATTLAAGGGKIHALALTRLPLATRWRRKAVRWRHRRLARRLATARGEAEVANVAAALRETEARATALQGLQEANPSTPLGPPAAGGCDVWLLPHVSLERRFAAATVVVVHDMVPLRAAGLVKPHDLESFRRRSQAITEEATLVGCMSRVIRDADVVGLLGCPAEKTRIVLPAVPADLVESHTEPTATARHAAAGKPYLFYPSAFRPYKNHALLIETAAALAGTPAAVDLVFTGDGRLPDDLARLAKRLGVAGRVHVLGRVPRGELASLYRNATATIVPSRYEQGSFPLLEAMQWGSPVAASDIPALREAFAPLGGAIPFFNPDDACGLARIVAEIAADREAVRAAQRPGFEMLCRRNWQQVADEWIDVFVEAIRLHAATAPSAAAGMP